MGLQLVYYPDAGGAGPGARFQGCCCLCSQGIALGLGLGWKHRQPIASFIPILSEGLVRVPDQELLLPFPVSSPGWAGKGEVR